MQGEPVRIEYTWVGAELNSRPLLVFLHEGLGSVSMWRDFPARLCAEMGCRGLVYSRPGYGRSAFLSATYDWAPDYMHREARDTLPAVLQALKVNSAEQPLWLVGHSDGGSIALIYAAYHADRVAGLVVLAPHIMVEDLTVRSIEQARRAYQDGALRSGLSRHHDDPDATFWRWNQIWLSQKFRDWSIESELGTIRCPVLALQGVDDPYGTLEQVHGIRRRVPKTRVVELAGCAHSPHRDQPKRLIAEVISFIRSETSC